MDFYIISSCLLNIFPLQSHAKYWDIVLKSFFFKKKTCFKDHDKFLLKKILIIKKYAFVQIIKR